MSKMNGDNQDEINNLIENFTLQLSEAEMLSSMYPNDTEFQITLPSVLADMNRYVDGKTSFVPSELDFILNLQIPDIKETLEVSVSFPHLYPVQRPSISCRSIGLNRTQQKELNCSVRNYLNDLPEGELCILLLIDWLLENAAKYFSLKPNETKVKQSTNSESQLRETLCRMWIYSHHIYNKFKRREIVDTAQDSNLTGFSLPGKPGFVCIEGSKRDCSDFFQNLKQMCWKKISLVKEEIDDSGSPDFHKFDTFQEICFQVRRGPAREYHMDMGQFLKYLEEHNCAYAFNDLFGLEGHTVAVK